MPPIDLFHILNTVDSTNNYAMAKLHEGLAKHGMAWYAKAQTNGRGQRGRTWESQPNESIALSVISLLPRLSLPNQFKLSAHVALGVRQFLQELGLDDIKVKWPNDLYINDRKAGGILIENLIQGSFISASVIGIGLNINQTSFDAALNQAISVCQLTGRQYPVEELARNLHQHILQRLNLLAQDQTSRVMDEYNAVLYKKDELVKFKKENIVFEALVKRVNPHGQLILEKGGWEEAYSFAELSWLLSSQEDIV